MATKVEMGTISSRGQVAIPTDIRTEMGLEPGTKVLFVGNGDTLLVKKMEVPSWEELTKPLRAAAKKAGFKESEVPELVHRYRKARNR